MRPAAPVSTVALRTLPIFEPLAQERLEEIAHYARLFQVPRNTEVVHAGDTTNDIYVVLTGTLKVQISDQDGREVILSQLSHGDMFGEMGAIDDHPRSATVVTTQVCDLVVIPKEDFKRCLASNFDVALHIIRSLTKRLREADRKIESLALVDVFGRVARLLLDMSEERDGRRLVTKHITRQDIAKTVGASREMVSRVMRDLQLQGLIEETADGQIWLQANIDSSGSTSS
jgi:CRP/FNR family cyclic AMP-dependent transcriptional regulator